MKKYNTSNNYSAKRVLVKALVTAAVLGTVAAFSSTASADEFTVGHTGADAAASRYGLNGSNVTVAIVDSGIHLKEDLKDNRESSRLLAQVSFVAGQYPDDKCGHGTHIAGIIAGSGKCSSGGNCFRTFYGIARNANLVNVRVLDQAGQGTVSQVVSGIQWVVQNRTRYNIRVMNLSMGHPVGESCTTDPLCQAVEAAWKAGIVVVCAAGNDGRFTPGVTNGASNEGYGTNYGSIQSPGNDPYVITVGAMKNTDNNKLNDRIATYSGRGPSRLDYVMKPDIVAPGNKVIALCADNSFLDNYAGNTNDIRYTEYMYTLNTNWSSTYFRLSGTSMAAPVVAGAAALMLQKAPTLTPDTIKARLMISADKWADPLGNADPCTYGAGYLNIPAALNCTAVPTRPAASPALSQDANGNVFVDASRVIWGTDVKGARVIWGVSGVNDLRVIWGTRVLWGTSANVLDASRVLWGTNVWYDRIIWGTSSSAVDLTSTAINGE